MKIAIVHRDLPPVCIGGVSYQVFSFANSLVKAGHRVTVFTLSPKPERALFEVVTVKVPRVIKESRMFSYYFLSYFLSRIDYSLYDVIHSHGDAHFPFFNRPLVRTFHGSALMEALHPSSFRRFLVQMSLYPIEWLSGLLSDWSVGISNTTKRCLPFIVNVIPDGVDLEKYVPSAQKSEPPSVLFVGTLGGRKRGYLLLNQFRSHVLKAIPDCELWMVCSERFEDRDNVRWLGRVSTEELIGLYQKAWVFCMPSSYEGFGVPYIEAMACGTPVVTTPNPGAMEVLENGKFGLTVPPDRLGECMIDLLKDRQKREKLICMSLEHVKKYSWERIVDSYQQIYHKVRTKESKEEDHC